LVPDCAKADEANASDAATIRDFLNIVFLLLAIGNKCAVRAHVPLFPE
jgi:hypothetical protein